MSQGAPFGIAASGLSARGDAKWVGLALFSAVSLLPFVRSTFRRSLRRQSTKRNELAEYWLQREDEHEFLKAVDGKEVMDWVKGQNVRCVERLGNPKLSPIHDAILSILNSKEKIPYVSKMGGLFYNLWQDEKNPRGLWRRTTLESYLSAETEWDNVLDLDQLGKDENESWVFVRASFCDLGDEVDSHLCMLVLSRGGSDATVAREFNLLTKSFVQGGFYLPEGKSAVSWSGADTLIVGVDMKDGKTTTDSGYPRQVREWRRGSTIESAPVVFEGQQSDVASSQYCSRHGSWTIDFRVRSITFYTSQVSVRFPSLGDEWYLLEALPADAEVSQFSSHLLISLRSDWQLQSRTVPSGSLLAVDAFEFATLGSSAAMHVLFSPSQTSTLQSFAATSEYLVLDVLVNICSKLVIWKLRLDRNWEKTGEEPQPAVRGTYIRGVDHHSSSLLWVTTSSFSKPDQLRLLDCALVAAPAGVAASPAALPVAASVSSLPVIRSLPRAFNRSDNFVERQLQAVSRDGTTIPYFVVHRSDYSPAEGPMPTLLYGYGGFEISLTAGYVPIVGCGWLERPDCDQHRCYVVANIRGGGEFGPRWHQAALRENRQRAYDDFIAVAEDLIAKGLTSAKLLGIRGGSNGGLLMGNMLVQRPDLFSAVCCTVPLLNMMQYHKLLAGASWTAEYGDPEVPEDWAFLQNYSPYHNVTPGDGREADRKYPALLMTTSTRDDRVHPYHARCFSKRLMERPSVTKQSGSVERGEVLYYENIEGGHGASADNYQRAFMDTLYLEFLHQTLRK